MHVGASQTERVDLIRVPYNSFKLEGWGRQTFNWQVNEE